MVLAYDLRGHAQLSLLIGDGDDLEGSLHDVAGVGAPFGGE
jgi:hypothetical protein